MLEKKSKLIEVVFLSFIRFLPGHLRNKRLEVVMEKKKNFVVFNKSMLDVNLSSSFFWHFADFLLLLFHLDSSRVSDDPIGRPSVK